MRLLLPLLPLLALLASEPAWTRKPPRAFNVPERVRHYLEVEVRLDRGRLRLGRIARRHAPEGKELLVFAGPYRIRLEDEDGDEIGRYEFGFPLLGPGPFDERLAAGMTASTIVLVPHPRELARIVAEGPGQRRAERRVARRRR